MKRRTLGRAFALAVLTASIPAFSAVAPVPPMGWNSYDSFDDSVTESEVIAQAQALHDKLLPSGWNIVVVDFRWYDPGAPGSDQNATDNQLTMDANGRLLPAVNRFPSATGTNGFKPLADQIHGMGLKFGIHIMRGIARQAYQANSAILGSAYHAQDAADTVNVCTWNRDMYGVKGDAAAGQAYYDSIFQLYASWGIDFVKVDDMIRNVDPINYHRAEVEAIRKAIDKTGRSIVLSLSPGEMQPADAAHLAANANMWRVANDFWDKWTQLDYAFTLADRWKNVAGPGHFPDEDMLTVGHLGPRCPVGGANRNTNFTHDEQTTMLSLWAIFPSPLMLGANLTQLDAFTTALLTNADVIAVNQDPLGAAGQRLKQQGSQEVWVKKLTDGSTAVGLFNRAATSASMSVTFAELGLTGAYRVRNLWQSQDLGLTMGPITATVLSHGSALFRIGIDAPPGTDAGKVETGANDSGASPSDSSPPQSGGGGGSIGDDSSTASQGATLPDGSGTMVGLPGATANNDSAAGCACSVPGHEHSNAGTWLAGGSFAVGLFALLRRRGRESNFLARSRAWHPFP